MNPVANNSIHWKLLSKAVATIRPTDFNEYFELKRLSQKTDTASRREMQTRFANYYRLHIGGLTKAFKRRYLALLLTCKPRGKRDPYTPLLKELYRFPRRKGDRALQVSFVSKLVAFHDESRPLYDVHVKNFFGFSPPSVGSIDFRIAGFVANLQNIQTQYEAWSANPRFAKIMQPLFKKNPALRKCHPNRLCDFLVWTVGAYDLK
jgi:hypothetical protein